MSTVAIDAQPRLRLTKRGRAVLTALVAIPLALSAMAFVGNPGSAVATDNVSSGQFEYVSVETGQSLWQIASAVAPKDDPRDVISAIIRLNQLPSAIVQAGQQLAIPAEYSH